MVGATRALHTCEILRCKVKVKGEACQHNVASCSPKVLGVLCTAGSDSCSDDRHYSWSYRRCWRNLTFSSRIEIAKPRGERWRFACAVLPCRFGCLLSAHFDHPQPATSHLYVPLLRIFRLANCYCKGTKASNYYRHLTRRDFLRSLSGFAVESIAKRDLTEARRWRRMTSVSAELRFLAAPVVQWAYGNLLQKPVTTEEKMICRSQTVSSESASLLSTALSARRLCV